MFVVRTAMVCVLVSVFSLCSTLTPAVRAQVMSTESYLALEQGEQKNDRVAAFLDREEVRAQLVAMGVDPEQAKQRISMLSSSEVELLQSQINDLPAGAGVLEVIGIVFIVLLILELIGVTNVFSRI